MLLKKIWHSLVVAAAMLLPVGHTHAQDIVNLAELGKEEEDLRSVEYDFFTAGPTLLFSDSPEMVYKDGVLYRDTVSGSVRLFFHHVNAVKPDKKLAVIVKNTKEMHPVELNVIRRGISEPMYDWLQAGKDAQKAYLKHKQELTHKSIGFGDSVELLTGRGRLVEHNQLVTGIVDLELSRPAEISVVLCEPKTDLELFNEAAKIQPMDEHPLRGTFTRADYHYVLKHPVKIKDDTVYTLKMADAPNMIQGIDKTTGLPAVDNGNYGVLYTVDFSVAGKQKIKLYFNPIGGEFAGQGILEHNGKRKYIDLPKDYSMGKTIEDMVELGTLAKGDYRFIWSPPGSANLPVRMHWKCAKPLKKNKTPEKEE